MLPGLFLTLFGIALNPLWRLAFDRRGIVEAYAAGLIFVGAGCFLLLKQLLAQSRRRRISRAPAGWPERLGTAWLALAALYLFAELAATAVIVAGGQRAALMEFRRKELGEGVSPFIPHPFLVYVKNPDYKEYKINRYGFIGPDWPVEKAPGSLRIACLGGSTTEDGYPEAMEKLLQRDLGGRRVETLDFGMSAWTSAQCLINYALNVRHFHPDYIVVHEGANDFKALGFAQLRTDYAHAFRPQSPPVRRIDAPLVRALNSYALLKRFLYTRRNLAPGPSLTEQVLLPADDYTDASRQIDELTAIFRSNIQALLTLAREDGTRVVVMTMPYSRTKTDWTPAFPRFMQAANDALRGLAAGRGLVLLDLDRELAGREDLFFKDPLHLSPEGVRLKSEAIARAIENDLKTSGGATIAPPAP